MEKRKALYSLTITYNISGKEIYNRVSKYKGPVPEVGDLVKSNGLEFKVTSRIMPFSQDKEYGIIPKIWAIPNPKYNLKSKS